MYLPNFGIAFLSLVKLGEGTFGFCSILGKTAILDERVAASLLGLKKKIQFGKDPTVNTSFLADADRAEKFRQEQERLIKAYYDQLEKEKSDILEVTYSYWDGSGHRRNTRVKKGSTIGQFINECRNTLEKDFRELKSVSNENLLFIKEDLILPHVSK